MQVQSKQNGTYVDSSQKPQTKGGFFSYLTCLFKSPEDSNADYITPLNQKTVTQEKKVEQPCVLKSDETTFVFNKNLGVKLNDVYYVHMSMQSKMEKITNYMVETSPGVKVEVKLQPKDFKYLDDANYEKVTNAMIAKRKGEKIDSIKFQTIETEKTALKVVDLKDCDGSSESIRQTLLKYEKVNALLTNLYDYENEDHIVIKNAMIKNFKNKYNLCVDIVAYSNDEKLLYSAFRIEKIDPLKSLITVKTTRVEGREIKTIQLSSLVSG